MYLTICIDLFQGFHQAVKMPSKQKDWKRGAKRFLHRRVRVTQWLPEYNQEKFVCDMIAGVTVGLTVMPQALAYATLAGLEPQVRF